MLQHWTGVTLSKLTLPLRRNQAELRTRSHIRKESSRQIIDHASIKLNIWELIPTILLNTSPMNQLARVIKQYFYLH